MAHRPAPWTRRRFAKAGLALAGAAAAPAVLARARPRAVIVGGGAAGATAARELAARFPEIDVTLIEARNRYLTPFFANRFLGGMAPMDAFMFDYGRIAAKGRIRIINDRVVRIDARAAKVHLTGGGEIGYDRLVAAPGVSFVPNGLEGYDDAAHAIFPHAYAGNSPDQWRALNAAITDMDDGGVVAVTVPRRPYRCHPAPYERASLIAARLKRDKPRSKVLILDANNAFPLMVPMTAHWEKTFGTMIEWVPGDFGGRVTAVDAKARALITDDGRQTPAVANVIPPQRAAGLLVEAGLTGTDGWCKVDPATFESAEAPGVHLLGDAIDPGDMPRSAFSANSQAKVCAVAVGNALSGRALGAPALTNACYFLLEKDVGLVVGGAYRVRDGRITGIEGYASGAAEGAAARRETARAAERWYADITREMFG